MFSPRCKSGFKYLILWNSTDIYGPRVPPNFVQDRLKRSCSYKITNNDASSLVWHSPDPVGPFQLQVKTTIHVKITDNLLICIFKCLILSLVVVFAGLHLTDILRHNGIGECTQLVWSAQDSDLELSAWDSKGEKQRQDLQDQFSSRLRVCLLDLMLIRLLKSVISKECKWQALWRLLGEIWG